MAKWICARPAECCHPAEVAVAERLSRLDDGWLVVWGFRYGGESRGVAREGDFIVQDPDGYTCVLEVKSGQLRRFALTGYWEHAGGDNPADQLAAEVGGVVEQLRKVAGGAAAPFVHCALVLPAVAVLPQDTFEGQLQRSQVMGGNDLRNFDLWWGRYACSKEVLCGAAEARRQLLAAFGAGAEPRDVRFFMGETDSLLLRTITAEGDLLRQLDGNRQLLIEGGCGTGKTLLGLRQALHLAAEGDGQEVLLLAYNLALAEQLADGAVRSRLPRGRVTVLSWEALALELLSENGETFAIPDDPSARREAYGKTLPQRLQELTAAGRLAPRFDALVVDEAQDLDTAFPGDATGAPGAGWWTALTALLRDGRAARVTAFFDAAQRPAFRDPAMFRVDRLMAWWSQPARFRLRRSLRYTRPVFRYLVGLSHADGSGPGAALEPPEEFREGPEVEVRQVAAGGTAEAVREIVAGWLARGFCRADEILILGRPRDRHRSALGTCTHLGGIPLVDHSLRVPVGSLPYLNLHRAKGLDRLGIIVIDLPPAARLIAEGQREDLENLFAAASRSRQLLAVVAEEDG